MSTHILCAVDQSLEGRRACAVAADLSADLELDTALVNVIPERPRLWGADRAPTADDRQAQQMVAQRLLDNAAEDHNLEPVVCEVAVGSPSREILRTAEEQQAELIVVGSRGRGEVRSAVLGSVSASVAQNAPCPVVVAPPKADAEGASAGSRSAVVCGVEDAEHDAPTLMLASELAERLDGTLHGVHAYSESPIAAGAPFAPALAPAALPPATDLEASGEQMLDHAMSRAGVCGELSVMAGDPTEALIQAAQERDARLIVVGSHSRGRIAAALVGSVSRRLASRATTPVVVLPPKARPSTV